MSESNGLEEVVLVFDEAAGEIFSEMRFAEFQQLVEQQATLDAHAASVVNAAYASVGSALVVHGVVLFTLNVNEDGFVDASFNVPLAHLAENAGEGPDVGCGAVALACKGRCPVPWHAGSLWGPGEDGEEGVIMLIQKSVWRNRLGLQPKAHKETQGIDFASLQVQHRHLDDRLSQTIGEDGKVSLPRLIAAHSSQLSDVRQRYRDDLERQQRAYLEQIRDCRDEIQQLKSALRHEQDRSRRLQELLRGEL